MRDLKVFAKTLDEKAKAQIDLLLEQKPFSGCKIRIMPDVHAGAGCVIGFTANLGDKVIPNIVGVDIGCGMLTLRLTNKEIDLGKLDDVIRKTIPSGMATHEVPVAEYNFGLLRCYSQLKNIPWLKGSLGTLGGGNHFIEVDVDDDGQNYLVIHTGSRNLGKQVAEIYQNLAYKTLSSKADDVASVVSALKQAGREREIEAAIKKLKERKRGTPPRELCYLEGKNRDDYLHDMRLCQQYATCNRNEIANRICAQMGFGVDMKFETIHNYIDDSGMVRKGAISAQKGELLLIPMNMRDGCILGEGLGNEDWNYSAPHGAGRIMSRAKARAEITINEYAESMSGIFTTSVSAETIDEAPQAYKPMAEIVECISETVNVHRIIKPVFNFKASEVK